MPVSAQMRAQVSQLYVAMFGRAPDGEGLGFWVQQLTAGQSLTSVADTMFAVSAARAYYPSFMTNSEMVTSFYTKVLGRTPDADGLTFWTAKMNAAGATPGSVINQLISAVTTYAGTDAAGVASKALFMNKATVAQTYGESNGTVAGATTILGGVTSDATTVTTATALVTSGSNSAVTSTLTTGVDNLSGTSGSDIFKASILDNSNTLQSGDVISGGAGNDFLNADIGNSQKFAITAETSGIENVAIRAQAIAVDTNNNNMVNVSGDVTGNQVQIDAQRMDGVTQWESNNSRADVVIEDVRIGKTQITKEITIAMVETDPGHVDFGVYFDQYSLRAQPNTSATLVLQLMDTRSAAAGTGPLKDNPYSGFAFYLTAAGSTTPKLITVKSQAIDDALTYADLLTAIKAAVAAVPELASFTVTLGSNFIVNDTLGTQLTGSTIVLTSTAGGTISTSGTGVGWVASGVVPGSSGLHTKMDPFVNSTADLVTSKIILDDVGRGSTGGDLVVGGLSVGDTSSSQGVQRFEIEVRDNSKLETINSTNNTLQEVTIKNGVTSSKSFAYVDTTTDAGNLTVNGVSGTNGANVINGRVSDAQTGENAPLPGSAAQTARNFGFSDVRLIDATDFKGKLAFSAEVTEASIAKYLNLKDTLAPAADTVAFTYTGGLNDDTMFVQLDTAAVASRNTIMAGREDFTFTANGGAGNDTITLKMVPSALTGVPAATGAVSPNEAWYTNQSLNKNVFVNGGEGNDTIWTPGAGDVKIDGGAGNDTVYADNTGVIPSVAAVAAAVTAANVLVATATTDLATANAALAAKTTANTAEVTAVSEATAALAAANAILATAKTAAVTPDTSLAVANPKAVFVFNTSNQLAESGGYVAGAAATFDRKVNDLKSDTNESYNLYKAKLTVTFKGLSVTVDVGNDPAAFKTTDLQINQLIKKAINDSTISPVLSKLLEATDGPGNTLVVKSLIDGVLSNADLSVTLTAPAAADISATELSAFNSAWAPAVPYTTTTLAVAVVADKATFDTNADYIDQLADTGVTGGFLAGAASTSVGDHTIIGGAGDDVIVLSTTTSTTAAISSNDTVVFEKDVIFGKDTIVNFTAGAIGAVFGADKLDFSALGGLGANLTNAVAVSADVAAAVGGDKSITVFTSVATDTAATLSTLYTTSHNVNGPVTHVLIGVDAGTNVGKVYTVADAATTTDTVKVVAVGTIDLADVTWASLVAGANFA